MNVFATLKTVFFGSKFLSAPVPSDGTPRRDFVSALNGLMPLCRTIPGVHLAVDIREGRVALVLNWTSRTDGNALAGSYHYIVSDEDGVKEVSKSQVLPAENGKGNLPESKNEASKHPTTLIEKTEKEAAQSGSARKVINPIHSKDVEKEVGVVSSEGIRKKAGPVFSKNIEKEAAPVSSKEAVKKAKSCSLMQEVTAFLTSRYRFRFNVLTEETEVADVANITNIENNLPDAHLRYAKVDERWMNTLSMEAIETGIDCWDRDIQRFVRSRRISEYHPFTAYFEQLPEWDGKDRVSTLARRVSDNPVWVNGFHRWMLGLSAQWMQFHPDTNNANSANSINRANSVAPLLVSSRQGLGKSTFCRLLMPDVLKAYYTESYDLGSPASAEAKLAACGLINLDEFDKLSASKMPLLKNLMQASALNIRKAYKRSASALPRIASFIGTSNREDLLVDRTGSRRFLCVSLEHAIDCTTPVEYEQLYAQLKAELLSGERSWFNKEEEQAIQQHNALFYKHIPEEEVFRLCFRFATKEDHPQEVLTLSATQLFERMKSAHPSVMRGMTAYSLSRILPQLGERVHTAKGNVYRVVAC
ncbi:VapE family protein [Phocaeicola massiliensis]|uniref:VapE domain-containing protein n=3 Tax=Phocaeicola massiliensis TaxID=204516 RepID=UPI00234CCAA5|nr:VapE domain-containing protein [Phocaeicola massiliensis]MDC7197056.1 VapE family protein [Phocaeicola massiliensis]